MILRSVGEGGVKGGDLLMSDSAAPMLSFFILGQLGGLRRGNVTGSDCLVGKGSIYCIMSPRGGIFFFFLMDGLNEMV